MERDVTDLLKPGDVRELNRNIAGVTFIGSVREELHRLCRNYLTLWDELEHERKLTDKWVKRVTQLEQEIGALMR